MKNSTAEKNSGKNTNGTVTNDVSLDDYNKGKSNGGMEDDIDQFFKRKSYYIEEKVRILEVLIKNCKPILNDVSKKIDEFNGFNGIIEYSSAINFNLTNIQPDLVHYIDLMNEEKRETRGQSSTSQNSDRVTSAKDSVSKSMGLQMFDKYQKEKIKMKQKKKSSTENEFVGKKGQEIKRLFPTKQIKSLSNTTIQTGSNSGGKSNGTLKVNVRNILGVKQKDDWIFNLNIGNVMHLTPLTLDDLTFHIDNSHELSRDAMLEKVTSISLINLDHSLISVLFLCGN